MCEIIFWNNVPWLEFSALNFLLDLPLTREMDTQKGKIYSCTKKATWQFGKILSFKNLSFAKLLSFFVSVSLVRGISERIERKFKIEKSSLIIYIFKRHFSSFHEGET